MKNTEIEKFIDAVQELVPVYSTVPEDAAIARGAVSLCLIAEDGTVSGRIFGTDKLRGRETYAIAWAKASQVWITGYNTFDYERKIFNDEIDYRIAGLRLPDLIGYKGGQKVTLKDGSCLAVGFSGFRGTTDLAIVQDALEKAGI